jgi:hypothetical protein
MTPSSKYFSTYHPNPNNKKISTTDGILVTVAGIRHTNNSFHYLKKCLSCSKTVHKPCLYTKTY